MEKRDGDIYERLQQGDSLAVGDLYDRYEGLIYRYLYARTFRHEVAEDLCSKTFMKAIEALHRFELRGQGFAPWLYSIARNALLDFMRKNKAAQPGMEAIERLASDEDVPGAYERTEQAEEIRRAVETLAAPKREIVLLRVWEELSYDDIAVVVGKSAAHCRMIYHRSMKELRSVLELGLISIILLIAGHDV